MSPFKATEVYKQVYDNGAKDDCDLSSYDLIQRMVIKATGDTKKPALGSSLNGKRNILTRKTIIFT